MFGEKPLAFAILVLSTSCTLAFVADKPQSAFLKNGAGDFYESSASEHAVFKHAAWSQPCANGYHNNGYEFKNCASLLREEHRVGTLPWEDGHEPIFESYAGHLPIRSWKQDGYHGETNIWLQGGPGSSSMIGLFFENGPIRVNAKMKLERVPVSWADEYSILFIDQPVGTGYSYVTRLKDADNLEVTDDETIQKILAKLDDELHRDQLEEQELFEGLSGQDLYFKSAVSRDHQLKTQAPLYSYGYVKNERGVAADLLVFLDKFYQRYPEVQKADLYLTGESYAGKYVPALAYGIMESNKDRRRRHEGYESGDGDDDDMAGNQIIFPLKGIALGNSLTDPVTQVQIHADHAYFLGLITHSQSEVMRALQDQSVEEALKGRFLESNKYRGSVFELFENATGNLNPYDIRKGSIPNDWSRMEAFMNLDDVKNSLNIFGPRTEFLKENDVPEEEIKRIQEGRAKVKFSKDPVVLKTMSGDIMKSASWMVSSLLKQGIKVLAFQGVFDFRDAVAGSNSWIEMLEWPGQEEFLDAEREIWINDGKLAGYVTQVEGLSRVVILGAGHLAPMDQGENSFAMIKSLVEGTRLNQESFSK
ncbi:hypothetical protein BGZ80_000237 [Entomortierella chlamydospora]|uniref:Carboxypeptidase n=1 Tax=Entomortierella chlamydospora TaxID=101097 RepID=A0A9P6MT58_9FUNG|nr:hypothetical protein BGZ79_008778 [Entomortierella chlamydospora]KAG0012058.1 hypothetical protein BGZ80_000237 [Entomortierella chlamydospora]